MTWKERRLITVLSVILAILSAALLFVLGIRYRQPRDAGQGPAAQAAQAAAGVTASTRTAITGSIASIKTAAPVSITGARTPVLCM